MIQVHLQGNLAEFGGPYCLAAKTPRQVVSALCAQIKGFQRRFISGAYKIVVVSGGRSRDLDDALFDMRYSKDADMYITPVVFGAGKSTGKVIMGAVVMTAAIVAGQGQFVGPLMAGQSAFAADMGMTAISALGVTYGQIAGFGVTMMLGGIAQMLGAKTTSTAASTEVARKESYLFNGPVNSSAQGAAKPRVYGRFICGSVVISSDLVAERI